jgi:hypothetical protein
MACTKCECKTNVTDMLLTVTYENISEDVLKPKYLKRKYDDTKVRSCSERLGLPVPYTVRISI